MYYVIVFDKVQRDEVLQHLRATKVNAVFHYVPLHSSPAGMRVGRVDGDMSNTNHLSEHLIRQPLWVGITEPQQHFVVDTLLAALN